MQLYSNHDVRVLCDDCLKWLRSLESNSVDMVVTSPPYDQIRKYNEFTFDFSATARELYRVVRPGGVVIWNVADQTVKGSETCNSMRQAIEFTDIGFRLHDTMIYHKKNPLPSAGKRYHQAWEYVFCFSKGTPNTFNPIMRDCTYASHGTANQNNRGTDGGRSYKKTKRNAQSKVNNVFTYTIGGGHTAKEKVAYNHPALMHEDLARDQILTWSNEGDLIIDPFLGAGTTACVCLDTNRKFIGTDVSEEYCQIATERLYLRQGVFIGSD